MSRAYLTGVHAQEALVITLGKGENCLQIIERAQKGSTIERNGFVQTLTFSKGTVSLEKAC
jgi:hypothetical protein